MPNEGDRIVIQNSGKNRDRHGVYIRRRGLIYGWVLLDGEEEKQYFMLSAIRTIVVAHPVTPPPVARVIHERPLHQQGPPTDLSIESLLSEIQVIRTLLLKVEDDLRRLSLQND